jgi:hypothetical protein
VLQFSAKMAHRDLTQLVLELPQSQSEVNRLVYSQGLELAKAGLPQKLQELISNKAHCDWAVDVLQILVTDCPEVGRIFVDAGIIPVLCEHMRHGTKPFRTTSLSALAWLVSIDAAAQQVVPFLKLLLSMWDQASETDEIRLRSVAIFRLMARAVDEGSREVMRIDGVHTRLLSVMRARVEGTNIVGAASGVAFLIGHLENHPDLAADDEIMKLFDGCLTASLQDRSFGGFIFYPYESLEGLVQLASNELNKPLMVQSNLDSILNVLDSSQSFEVPLDDRTLLAATKVLTSLCFAVACMSVQQREIAEQRLNYHNDNGATDSIRKQAALGLFNLNHSKGAGAAHVARPQSDKGHVMLSYPWSQQALMLLVREWLEERGYTVWMDVSNMSGSLLDSMAAAVEDAACIVVAVCSDYKESNACRTEGEYAYRLRKKIIPIRCEDYTPRGWLGALVGNSLYFDLINTAHRHTLAQEDQASLTAFLTEVERTSSISSAVENKPAATPVSVTKQAKTHVPTGHNIIRSGAPSSEEVAVLLEKVEQMQQQLDVVQTQLSELLQRSNTRSGRNCVVS